MDMTVMALHETGLIDTQNPAGDRETDGAWSAPRVLLLVYVMKDGTRAFNLGHDPYNHMAAKTYPHKVLFSSRWRYSPGTL